MPSLDALDKRACPPRHCNSVVAVRSRDSQKRRCQPASKVSSEGVVAGFEGPGRTQAQATAAGKAFLPSDGKVDLPALWRGDLLVGEGECRAVAQRTAEDEARLRRRAAGTADGILVVDPGMTLCFSFCEAEPSTSSGSIIGPLSYAKSTASRRDSVGF